MNEGAPRQLSQTEKKEFPTGRSRVIESLKENPDDLTLLLQYHANRQDARDRGEISSLDYTIDTAEIYRDAGKTAAATESFEAACEHALGERDERYTYCMSELEKLQTV